MIAVDNQTIPESLLSGNQRSVNAVHSCSEISKFYNSIGTFANESKNDRNATFPKRLLVSSGGF